MARHDGQVWGGQLEETSNNYIAELAALVDKKRLVLDLQRRQQVAHRDAAHGSRRAAARQPVSIVELERADGAGDEVGLAARLVKFKLEVPTGTRALPEAFFLCLSDSTNCTDAVD